MNVMLGVFQWFYVLGAHVSGGGCDRVWAMLGLWPAAGALQSRWGAYRSVCPCNHQCARPSVGSSDPKSHPFFCTYSSRCAFAPSDKENYITMDHTTPKKSSMQSSPRGSNKLQAAHLSNCDCSEPKHGFSMGHRISV